jgi:hypothetical protein
MSITCGLWLGWPEEDEMDTATKWHRWHGLQEQRAPAFIAAVSNTYLQSAQGHTPDAPENSAVCYQYMCTMNHSAVSALTTHCTLAMIAWTLRKRSTPYKTSSTSTITKTGLTSCMEATILGRE